MLSIENHATFTLIQCASKDVPFVASLVASYDVTCLSAQPIDLLQPEMERYRPLCDELDKLTRDRMVVEACWQFHHQGGGGRDAAPGRLQHGVAAVLAVNDMRVYDSFVKDLINLCAYNDSHKVLGEAIDVVTYPLNLENIDDITVSVLTHSTWCGVKDHLRYRSAAASPPVWPNVKNAVLFDLTLSDLRRDGKELLKSTDFMRAGKRKSMMCGVYGPADVLIFKSDSTAPTEQQAGDALVASYKLKHLQLDPGAYPGPAFHQGPPAEDETGMLQPVQAQRKASSRAHQPKRAGTSARKSRPK